MSEIITYISKQALERFRKDKFVKQKNGSYVDNWNFKATKKEITLGNYGPYLEFTPL